MVSSVVGPQCKHRVWPMGGVRCPHLEDGLKDDDSLPELLCSLGKFMAPTGVEAAQSGVGVVAAEAGTPVWDFRAERFPRQ